MLVYYLLSWSSKQGWSSRGLSLWRWCAPFPRWQSDGHELMECRWEFKSREPLVEALVLCEWCFGTVIVSFFFKCWFFEGSRSATVSDHTRVAEIAAYVCRCHWLNDYFCQGGKTFLLSIQVHLMVWFTAPSKNCYMASLRDEIFFFQTSGLEPHRFHPNSSQRITILNEHVRILLRHPTWPRHHVFICMDLRYVEVKLSPNGLFNSTHMEWNGMVDVCFCMNSTAYIDISYMYVYITQIGLFLSKKMPKLKPEGNPLPT